MATFRECLLAAVEQGAISRQEADELARDFDKRRAQLKLSLGDDAAAAAAKDAIEKDLRAAAFEARRTALLADAAHGRLKGYLTEYRGLDGKPDVFGAVLNLFEHYGYAGVNSLKGRANAIISLAHGELADVLSTFRRSRVTGARFNKPLADDMVRDILGEPSGKPEAAAMAEAIAGVNETLRQRFNAAGGAIGKIEGGYLPQDHDAHALLGAGREAWKDYLRPRLDVTRMRDPLTGQALTADRLEASLDAAFDAITTDGWSKQTPQAVPFGRGALANQRAEHRFLVFQSADDWLAYNREFGSGDPVKSVFQHINGMARDVAALELLGPNPNATVEWLKQVVQTEAAKGVAGQPSLYNPGSKAAVGIADQIGYVPWRIDSVYQYVRGRQTASNALATGFGSVRNLLTSAVLGSASILAATTDPFIDMTARYLSGLPVTKALGGILKAVAPTWTREQAVRSGMILDDFLHIVGDEARYAGTLGGAEWSKWLADRTVNLSGLEPITQARKHVFALDFQAMLADHAEKPFAELPSYVQRTMRGYAIDATDWDVMRSAAIARPAPDAAGFLRPIDVARLTEGPALPQVQQLLGIDATDEAARAALTAAGVRRTAEKYLEMILGQTERAVPSGTARARSFVTGASPRGTAMGELLESGLQFKSFALSFTTLQLQAIQQELHIGVPRGAAYAGGLAIGLTLGGALALQIKNIANGKDPQPADDPRFWLQALQTGGGAGLLGDFLFADVNRFGHSFGEQLAGPVIGLVSDITKLTVGNVQKVTQGKDTHRARETLRFAQRYTPVASSLFYARAAYRRVLLDQLQYLTDPDARRDWRDQENRLRRETRQEFYWPPGEPAPSRPPQFAW